MARTQRRSALDDVLDMQAECARTGTPDPTEPGWSCGRCDRGPDDGVRMYYFVNPTPEGDVLRGVAPGPYAPLLVCPCCSTSGCPHRALAPTPLRVPVDSVPGREGRHRGAATAAS